MVAIFAAHGATYLDAAAVRGLLRASGRDGAAAVGARGALGIAIVAWTVAVAHDHNSRGILPTAIPAALTALALLAAALLTRTRRSGWAFTATALGAIGFVATIFTGLYPRVLVSHPRSPTASPSTTRPLGTTRSQVITIVAAIFTPLVLLYQGWTYHVFRKRLGGQADPALAHRLSPPCARSTRGCFAARGRRGRCWRRRGARRRHRPAGARAGELLARIIARAFYGVPLYALGLSSACS